MRSIVVLVAACCLTALAAGAQAQNQDNASEQQQGHLLNLEGADVRTLVSTVAEWTGRNFVVDPSVSGKVTVVSQTPLDDEALYTVFLTVLETHGLAAVDTGDVVKIVPESKASAGGPKSSFVTEIIAVQHVKAADMVNVLSPLLSQSAKIRAHEATNSVIVTERAGHLERVSSIIERVDRAGDEQIEMFRLEHASATELMRTLGPLMGDEGKLVADERTNTLMLSGEPATRLRLRTLISHLDTPLESAESTRVIYLRYAKAESLVGVLENVVRGMQGGSSDGEGGAQAITAHNETNSIIVNGGPAVYQAVKDVVRQLDVRRAQVHVEAVIADVSDDFARELGVQWQTAFDASEEGVFGGTNFGGPNSNILSLSANPAAAGSGLNIGYINGLVELPGSDTPLVQLGALLRARAEEGRVNILSTPSVVTLDNAEAQLSVGSKVPFVTGRYTPNSTVGDGGVNNPFQTIQREQVGLILKVTPQITGDQDVQLVIEQEVSSLAGAVQGAADLVTNERKISTTVMVGDGQTLVLGGLIDEDWETSEEKVPLLGDIPALGRLFRYDSTRKTKRNLMVFLRPTILHDAAISADITGSKYREIRRMQQQQRDEYRGTGSSADIPLLPVDIEEATTRQDDDTE